MGLLVAHIVGNIAGHGVGRFNHRWTMEVHYGLRTTDTGADNLAAPRIAGKIVRLNERYQDAYVSFQVAAVYPDFGAPAGTTQVAVTIPIMGSVAVDAIPTADYLLAQQLTKVLGSGGAMQARSY